MLTVEQNEELTSVGPDTPMGELLRRYWYPITATRDSRILTFQVRRLDTDKLARTSRAPSMTRVAPLANHASSVAR